MSTKLPKQFERLEPFVADWALETQNRRYDKRLRSSRSELRAFYDAATPLLPDALNYLDRFPLGQIPADDLPLCHLMLSLAEIAPHIELYGGDPCVPHAFDERRFVAEHGETVI
jgi:hypothetical protein